MQKSFQAAFTINPTSSTLLASDDIFEGLVENVSRAWNEHNLSTLASPFRQDSWRTDFSTLGIELEVQELFESRLNYLQYTFGAELVWDVLQTETVGVFAMIVLETEVEHFSSRQVFYNRNKINFDSEEDSDFSREGTPSPSILRRGPYTPAETSNPDIGGVYGFGEGQLGKGSTVSDWGTALQSIASVRYKLLPEVFSPGFRMVDAK
jgi:hypothetical protein